MPSPESAMTDRHPIRPPRPDLRRLGGAAVPAVLARRGIASEAVGDRLLVGRLWGTARGGVGVASIYRCSVGGCGRGVVMSRGEGGSLPCGAGDEPAVPR